MAKEYITKSHMVKDEDGTKRKVSVDYRVDADFVPTSISEICVEFMIEYCFAHGEGDWLDDEASKKVQITTKKGTVSERNTPFVTLRAKFTEKFFPEIIKGEKEKGPSTLDKIRARKAQIAKQSNFYSSLDRIYRQR